MGLCTNFILNMCMFVINILLLFNYKNFQVCPEDMNWDVREISGQSVNALILLITRLEPEKSQICHLITCILFSD